MELINNIQKKIYEVLSDKYAITDIPDESLSFPFVRIAECNYNIERAKGSKIKEYNLEQELHIWSNYEGKKEVNEIMGDVIDIIENMRIEENVICNYCASSNIVDLEGYKQGILLFNIKIDK